MSGRAFPGLEGLGAEVHIERKARSMALYEHIYLARQDISAQQVETLTEQLKATIESLGGKIEKIEYWGVKSLAYRIKKNRKAHFSLLNIDAPPAAITEMERQEGINEDIIRILTIRVEELEQGQSAMMRKRDDDDRGDRPDRGDRRGPRPDRGDRGPRRPRDDAGFSDEGGF
jgi:small subunit ribosomal protein S6